jgi:hypothetical protein
MPTYRPPHRTGHDAQRRLRAAALDTARIGHEAALDRAEAQREHAAAARNKRRPKKCGKHFHPTQFPHLPAGPATGHGPTDR